MKIIRILIATFIFFAGIVSCEEIIKDDESPVIDMSAADAFPQNCSIVKRGESFIFRAKFTDNLELGSYSIEMHHNFNHHTHSTSGVTCEMEPVKSAVNPFLKISEYSIPAGLKTYDAEIEVIIPAGVDTGDYHFMVRLTDKSGWQTFKGISMKISN